MDEVFQEKCRQGFVNSRNRLHRFFGPCLYERSDPFHKRLSDKCILPPTVEIQKTAHLFSGNQLQQIEAVRQADMLDGKEYFFERCVPHYMGSIRPREELIELFFGFNPQCRADQRTEHLIGHMPKL